MATPQEIVARYEELRLSDANEAETRLKVINEILYGVLGWTHDDIRVEDRVSEDGNTTFADYVITTGMSALVVEAKKVGVAFGEVPDTRRSTLRGRLVSGKTGEAIIQARDYARKMAIPFAAVTNGLVWIVYPATRTDQVSFANSSAVIFPTLKSALHDDFAEFYELLSRDAVINGSLENELLGRLENQIEERRLNRFFTTSFSKIKRRNIYPLIEDAINASFSENIVNADPELLEKLYVRTPDRTRFDKRIRMHIQKKESLFASSPIRPLREKGGGVTDLITRAAARAKPVAVLVLGQVGAGKTTFLEFTRKVGAADIFEADAGKPYPHWIYVDFRKFNREGDALQFLHESVRTHISNDLFLSDYERCLKHAYRAEIDALFRGPLFLLQDDEGERKRRVADLLASDYAKAGPYVEKVIAYAADRSAVFLVIDNVDQFEDEGVESKIFGAAMAFAQTINCNLICSMRESTFVRHKNSATFDAFDFDPVAIDPPMVQAVLSKRFFVARQLLQGKQAEFTAENGALMKVADLAVVIDLVQTSVLGTSIGTVIEVLATSDIRLALRMTREFLRSGWTASGKALRIYEETGKYYLPPHEALRAIMLGNQQVYSEELSVLGNPFDSRLARTEAQLLRLYVLNACVLLSSEGSFRYIEGEEIKSALRSIGFGDDIVLRVLTDLCRLRFLHTLSHTAPSLESSFIVSRLGGYIIRHFMADMMYLENVMMDTFIADTEAWEKLRRLTAAVYADRSIVKRMALRRERVVYFHELMSRLYAPLREDSMRRGLAKHWCGDPLQASANLLKTNLEKIMGSAERLYGPDAASVAATAKVVPPSTKKPTK
jgi:hypothetical protein